MIFLKNLENPTAVTCIEVTLTQKCHPRTRRPEPSLRKGPRSAAGLGSASLLGRRPPLGLSEEALGTPDAAARQRGRGRGQSRLVPEFAAARTGLSPPVRLSSARSASRTLLFCQPLPFYRFLKILLLTCRDTETPPGAPGSGGADPARSTEPRVPARVRSLPQRRARFYLTVALGAGSLHHEAPPANERPGGASRPPLCPATAAPGTERSSRSRPGNPGHTKDPGSAAPGLQRPPQRSRARTTRARPTPPPADVTAQVRRGVTSGRRGPRPPKRHAGRSRRGARAGSAGPDALVAAGLPRPGPGARGRRVARGARAGSGRAGTAQAPAQPVGRGGRGLGAPPSAALLAPHAAGQAGR